MLTGKERAELRKHANTLETVCYIGKDNIDEQVVEGIAGALKARELIKIKLQENSMYTAREASAEICEKLGAEPIQTIGRRFVIYKRNKKIDKYGI